MIKSWLGYIISTVEIINGYSILVGKQNTRDTFGDRSTNGKTVLKCISDKYRLKAETISELSQMVRSVNTAVKSWPAHRVKEIYRAAEYISVFPQGQCTVKLRVQRRCDEVTWCSTLRAGRPQCGELLGAVAGGRTGAPLSQGARVDFV
jgi:hypothetical protein